MSGQAKKPRELLEVLRAQLLANEQLVLAGLRAHEEIERVLAQRLEVEREVSDLRDREKALQSTATFRARVLEVVGSDFKAPLEKIVDSAELMTCQGDLRPSDAALASQIVTVGTRLTTLLKQLADYTQALSTDGFPLQASRIDFGILAARIAAQVRGSTSIPIEYTQSGNVVGTGDESRVTEALASIVRHSADCADEGTAVLVHCREAQEDRILVEVSNRGPCIPADRLSLVLAAFNRGQLSGSAGLAHLGLGLLIASQVAAAHGGSLDVRSLAGVTTFTFEVPRTYAASGP